MLRTTLLLLAVVLAVSTFFFSTAFAADLPTSPTEDLVEKVLAQDPGFNNDPETLRETIAKGPNFAKDYILVRHSCGTPCQSGFVIDTNNNDRLIQLPGAECEYAFDIDNRTLIINPTPAEYTVGGVPMQECAQRRIYMFRNGKFVKSHERLTNDQAFGKGYIVTKNSD